MKNNKGFTLIELLAVIVLLAVITTLAVPSIMNISKKTKENMLETKLNLIKEDAKLYGQDHLNELWHQTQTLHINGSYDTSMTCKVITIGYLLEKNYLTSDKDDAAAGYIVNPVDNSSLNDKKIILYLKNKRVVATYEEETVNDKTTGEEVTTTYSCP